MLPSLRGGLSPTIGVLLAPATGDSELAIAASALLDAALSAALYAALPGEPSAIQSLVRPYHQRRTLACAVGLVDAAHFHDLNIITRIRNAFAHDIPRPTFATRAIADRCRFLSTYRKGLAPRAVFLRAVAQLLYTLDRRP